MILVVASSIGFTAAEAPAAKQEFRISHAKELLGSFYKKSIVREGEHVSNVSKFVLATTKKFLPSQFQSQAKATANAIVVEAERHGFDPIFLMAVIQNESSFNPKMKGRFGEIGLMQVKPDTAKWIAKLYGFDYKGANTLYSPVVNIKYGTALLSKLRHQFESQSRLYISAYNIGAKRVRELVNSDNTPKEYVQAVMKRYIALYHAFEVDGADEQAEAAYAHVRKVTQTVASN